ncbi:MAG: helix-turn-helix domain-containing protein [Micromonosporaceae bacterium]|nr:helix-turn-helix domain-containing protein [Micromonosporaceae bacterium]
MPRRTVVDPRLAPRLRELLGESGISFRALAARTYYSKSYIHALATGVKAPTVDIARRLDDVMGAGGQLAALVAVEGLPGGGDELEALELARRAVASDVGEETLTRLERQVDDLATLYAATPPQELLQQVRQSLSLVRRLLDARTTLSGQRRLLVAGGWLSLLAATIHIDLRQSAAAEARLGTGAELAGQSDHPEIAAWCLETRAWDVLTGGDYPAAVDLSRQAQATAPQGSSALIQATAQEGRAWARMGRQAETRDALDRVARMASTLAVPDRPEHHYRYDPDKALSYTATTLAWAGDPAAEGFTRTLIRQLENPGNGTPRPRRVASARLDLALALLAAGEPEEGAAEATNAISSGRVVPSNWWRAAEVLAGVERLGVRQAADLREVYEVHRPSQ